MNSSREQILNRIRQTQAKRELASQKEPDTDSPIYKEIIPSQILCFKNELETVSGLCTICNSTTELYQTIQSWLSSSGIRNVFCKDELICKELSSNNIPYTSNQESFEGMEAAITGCEYLVARTGSIVVSSAQASGRQLNFFPPVHIVIANKNQLVDYPEDALTALKEKYKDQIPSMMSFISGPSRTADIEKTLVLGAHGPKVLHVFILE